MENQDNAETRPSSEQETVSENNSSDENVSNTPPEKRKSSFHSRKFQPQLKLFNLKEQEWVQALITDKTLLFVRDHEGKDLENLVLLGFNANEGRAIECEQEGQKIQIPKINCVFIAKMAQKQQIQELSKTDEKKLPRLTYHTPEGEERWLFPQTETLVKMQQNLGGIFILTDQHMYRGRVYWFTRWNLFLSLAKGCEIFIFKHACMRWSTLFKKKFSPRRFPSDTRDGNGPPRSNNNDRPSYSSPKPPSEKR